MSGPFDFLHIKSRTAGSSNELSFDVLDAARDGIDSQKKRSSRTVTGPKPSQGSYHGVAGTSTFSSAPEVEKRKKRRRAHTARIGAIAAIAVIAFIGAGVYFGYHYYVDTMDFNGRYNSLVNRMSEMDSTLVEVDELMKSSELMLDTNSKLITTGTSDQEEAAQGEGSSGSTASSSETGGLSAQAQKLSDDIVGIKRELNAIEAESQQLRQLAKKDEDKAALSHLSAAASAREDMLSHMEEALEVAHEAGIRIEQTNVIWSRVLAADEMARDAAEMANEASTEEATVAARRKTEQARELFEEARTQLDALGQATPKISFKEETAYLEKRVESLDAAVKTANALVINNRESAIAANDDYNKADDQAAKLALKLPSSEGEKAAEAYAPKFKEAEQKYEESRDKAATADSAIRAYVQPR